MKGQESHTFWQFGLKDTHFSLCRGAAPTAEDMAMSKEHQAF